MTTTTESLTHALTSTTTATVWAITLEPTMLLTKRLVATPIRKLDSIVKLITTKTSMTIDYAHSTKTTTEFTTG